MKKKINFCITGMLLMILLFPPILQGQSEKSFVRKYLNTLPDIPVSNSLQKYRMTAFYTNRDLVGNFTGKTLVSGEYTRGLEGDSVKWNNCHISNASSSDGVFPESPRLDYIEDFTYIPSPEMLKEEAFRSFPSSPENIFARNLIWDMYSLEIFAWQYYDSLELNKPYIIHDISGEFSMAEIGKYSHNKIVLKWEGITRADGELCAVISFNAIDNLIQLDMPVIKSKGTEQYWGTLLISLKTKTIRHAVMYSGTMQELSITGRQDKILAKTIRELVVERIQ